MGGQLRWAPARKVRMANKTKVTPPEAKKEAQEKQPLETPDVLLPLFDLSDAAVREMIKAAKTRGYVTDEHINAALPPDEVTSEQIEDILATLNDVGINIVESEEAEWEEEAEERDEPRQERGRDRDRQAHRSRPRGDDRWSVREPANLPGHYHLARRAQRRQDLPARYHRHRGDLFRPSRQGDF